MIARSLSLAIFMFITFAFLTSDAIAAPALAPWGPMSEIEASARRERKLVIYSAPGHVGPEAQTAISQVFKQRYGISIEWVASRGAEMGPRLAIEQRTKQYIADLAMSGIAGVYVQLKPMVYLVPIMAPSTLEKSAWRLDPAAAMPKDRDWLYLYMPLIPSFFVNTGLVRSGERSQQATETCWILNGRARSCCRVPRWGAPEAAGSAPPTRS